MEDWRKLKKKERFGLSGWMVEVRVERSSLGGESCMHGDSKRWNFVASMTIAGYSIYIYGSLVERYFRKWFMDVFR